MNIQIRKAVPADCRRMMELVFELAVFEKAPTEVTVTLEHFIEAGFGKNPVWYSLVAVAGNEGAEEIVGISLYYMRYSTWKGLRLYLEDLIVTEAFRGMGIGKMLFEQTLEVARNQGIKGVMWQVLDWNEPAINFYKKYGAVFDGEWLNCSLNLDR